MPEMVEVRHIGGKAVVRERVGSVDGIPHIHSDIAMGNGASYVDTLHGFLPRFRSWSPSSPCACHRRSHI